MIFLIGKRKFEISKSLSVIRKDKERNDLSNENKELLRYLTIAANFIEKILTIKNQGSQGSNQISNKGMTQETVDKFKYVELEIKKIQERM